MNKERAFKVAQASLPVYIVQKGYVCGLLVGMAFTVTTAIGAERDVLDTWKQAISKNDFKKTLTVVKTLKEDWPAVHSVKHAINKDEEKAVLQTGYRDIAKIFWQDLENYEKELRGMTPEAFCEGADVLLEARNRFLKHPSYVNYFLADSINRVVYINLGERLIKTDDVPICYDRIVERLAELRCDLPQLVALINREHDTNAVSMAEIKESPLPHPLQTIGKVFGQENFFAFPKDMHNLYGLRILGKRSFSALFKRLVISDHVIGACLPTLLSYRRKASYFTPMDEWDKIHAVLGDKAWLPSTLWNPQPHAVNEVVTFLREIQSEKWRWELSFSEPSIFTKETVEMFERQEAEREAQREAKP